MADSPANDDHTARPFERHLVWENKVVVCQGSSDSFRYIFLLDPCCSELRRVPQLDLPYFFYLSALVQLSPSSPLALYRHFLSASTCAIRTEKLGPSALLQRSETPI